MFTYCFSSGCETFLATGFEFVYLHFRLTQVGSTQQCKLIKFYIIYPTLLILPKLQIEMYNILLKFIYSEKALQLCEISTVDLSYVVPVKSTV